MTRLKKPNVNVTETLDCIGLFCPLPVLKVRQALDRLPKGKILEVLADDPASEKDIPTLVKMIGQKLLYSGKEGDKYRFIIKKLK